MKLLYLRERKVLFAMKNKRRAAKAARVKAKEQNFVSAKMSTYKFLMIVVHFDDCVLGLTSRWEEMSCVVFVHNVKQQCFV